MSSEAQPEPPKKKRPFWRDPFAMSFIIGAVVLTALPLLQRRFLKAPAPVMTLPEWELPGLAGGTGLSSTALKGRVWLAGFVASPCDAGCVERLEAFGREVPHLEDLDGGVQLVSFVLPGAGESSLRLAGRAGPNWHFTGGTSAEVEGVVVAFREGWGRWAGTDAGATWQEFGDLPGFALVDQDGAVRGFWRDDVAGRGNLVNAARLLWQHGPRP